MHYALCHDDYAQERFRSQIVNVHTIWTRSICNQILYQLE